MFDPRYPVTRDGQLSRSALDATAEQAAAAGNVQSWGDQYILITPQGILSSPSLANGVQAGNVYVAYPQAKIPTPPDLILNIAQPVLPPGQGIQLPEQPPLPTISVSDLTSILLNEFSGLWTWPVTVAQISQSGPTYSAPVSGVAVLDILPGGYDAAGILRPGGIVASVTQTFQGHKTFQNDIVMLTDGQNPYLPEIPGQVATPISWAQITCSQQAGIGGLTLQGPNAVSYKVILHNQYQASLADPVSDVLPPLPMQVVANSGFINSATNGGRGHYGLSIQQSDTPHMAGQNSDTFIYEVSRESQQDFNIQGYKDGSCEVQIGVINDVGGPGIGVGFHSPGSDPDDYQYFYTSFEGIRYPGITGGISWEDETGEHFITVRGGIVIAMG